MIITRKEFGHLKKWTQTTLQHGQKAVQQIYEIVRCCAKHIIELREINKIYYYILISISNLLTFLHILN